MGLEWLLEWLGVLTEQKVGTIGYNRQIDNDSEQSSPEVLCIKNRNSAYDVDVTYQRFKLS